MTALLDDYDTDSDADLRAAADAARQAQEDTAEADAEMRAAADLDAQRAHAERQAQYRARARRDKLVDRVGVLDELPTNRTAALTSARPAIGQVAQFFGIDVGPLHTLLRYRRDEFLSDGWQPGDAEAPQHDKWTDEAILRAALLLDPGESEAADELRYHLGEGELPVVYCSRPRRVEQCAKDFERAMELIGAVQGDASPHDVWRYLQDMPRYELQSLVITAAALVPLDTAGMGSYLRQISGKNGSVAHGLALLIPRPSKLFRRRRGPGRARWSDQPGGVSVTSQR